MYNFKILKIGLGTRLLFSHRYYVFGDNLFKNTLNLTLLVKYKYMIKIKKILQKISTIFKLNLELFTFYHFKLSDNVTQSSVTSLFPLFIIAFKLNILLLLYLLHYPILRSAQNCDEFTTFVMVFPVGHIAL